MTKELISKRFQLIAPLLDEKQLRLYVATEALVLGRGGITLTSQATGVSRPTITMGCKELLEQGTTQSVPKVATARVRKVGGGRKRTTDIDETLRSDLEGLVEPVTRGDPESPLRWTSKSVRKLADELKRMGHKTSHRMVAELLQAMDYSLQANRKTAEGSSHPDRNDQFEYIYREVKEFQSTGQPVISVDTKKKERVGDFKNGGRELRPKGNPEKVRVYDFEIPELGKVAPYGVYDQTRNIGWVKNNGEVNLDNDSQILIDKNIQIFSTGDAFAALKSNGLVVTWGEPYYGGDHVIREFDEYDSPISNIDVINELHDVKNIFSTYAAFAALRDDGSVVTWGRSNNGGDSSTVPEINDINNLELF